MSLLNDMLRDLSHQQKPVDALSTGATPTLDLTAQEQRELFNQSSAAKPLPRNVVPSLIVFVIVLAIATVWMHWRSEGTQILPEQKIDQHVNSGNELDAAERSKSAAELSEIDNSTEQEIDPPTEAKAVDVVAINPIPSDPELVARLAALENAITTLTNTVADNKTIAGTLASSSNEQAESASVSVKDPFAIEEPIIENAIAHNAVQDVPANAQVKSAQVVQALSNEPAHLEIGPNPKWKDEEQARQARELAAQGQVSLAIEKLQVFITSAQQPRESVKTLLDITMEQNDIESTQRILAQSDFLLGHEQAYYQAKILVSQQQEAQAIELLEVNLVDADNDENYRALLAGLYQKNGRSMEAANHYRRLLSIFGDKPAYWLGFALSQDALNQPQVALQAYQRVSQYTDLPPQVHTYIQQRLSALQQ